MEPEPTYKSNIMNIIKSFYHISQPVSQDVFLYTNFKDGKHILLSKEVHNLLEKGDQGIHDLYLMYPEISQKLYEEGFLIKKDINELDEIKSRREKLPPEETCIMSLLIPLLIAISHVGIVMNTKSREAQCQMKPSMQFA